MCAVSERSRGVEAEQRDAEGGEPGREAARRATRASRARAARRRAYSAAGGEQLGEQDDRAAHPPRSRTSSDDGQRRAGPRR